MAKILILLVGLACLTGLTKAQAAANATTAAPAPATTAAPAPATTAAPAATTAAPAPATTAAPAATTAAPAPATTAAPAATTAAPAPATTAAPAATTAAPAPATTAAPAATTAAPAPATTAAPVATTQPKAKGLSVKCTKDEMVVKLDIKEHSSLRLDSITLKDTNCAVFKNDGNFVYLRSPLDGCGTTHNTTKDAIKYYNSIKSETRAATNNAKISRDFIAEFPFVCTFDRTAIVSVVSFSPRRKVVYTKATGLGNFTFTMDLYESGKYADKVSSYPYEINLNEPLYLRAMVASNDSKLSLFVDDCWATPVKDPDHKIKHDVISNGCKKDTTVLYDFGVNKPQQSFSVKSFRFKKVNSDNVHIHCRLEACRKGDKSNCALGCQGKRKRRSLISDATSEVLTVGTIQIASNANAQSATGSASSLTTASVIAGVLAVVVMGLVAALFVIYKKRQPLPTVAFTKVTASDADHLV